MKHVFLVNSHMTFLTAQNVVKHYQFAKADCVFMMARDYPLLEDGPTSVVFPFSNFPQDTFGAKQWPWIIWKKIAEADQFLTELTEGQDFHFYAPQSSTTHFYIIISHSKCTAYSFLEGGIGCYHTFHQSNATHQPSWWRQAFYSVIYQNRVPVEKFFYNISLPKYKYAYGSNAAAFADYPGQKVIGFPFSKKQAYESIENVIVLDAIVEFYHIKEQSVEQLLAQVFQHLAGRGQKKVHFKLHPEHYREERLKQRYYQMFTPYKEQFEIIELDKTVKLEDVAFSAEVTFYTFISSIGIYANLMGREVICLAKRLHALEPSLDFTYKKVGDKAIKYL